MKKLFTLLIVSALLFTFTFTASAKVITENRGAIEITKDEVINDDLFLGGEMIQIDGTVNGDVYAAAETVRVNGVINGDLHIGAGMVSITGEVTEDVYIGAGEVAVNNATIGDSLIIGAGNVNLDKESTIGGSLITGAGSLAVYSTIGRNLMAGAGKVDLNASITGEASIGSGELNVGPDTKIGKDLYYAVDDEESNLRISETASVAGQTRRVELDEERRDAAKKGMDAALEGMELGAKIISLLGAILVGYLIFRFAPKPFVNSTSVLGKDFLKSLSVGFLVLVLAFPVLLILALTGVGLPLAGITFLFLLIAIYLAKIPVGLFLGQWLVNKFEWKNMSLFKTFTIGLIVIYLLKALPIIGFFVSLGVLLSGLGAQVLSIKSRIQNKNVK